MPEEREQIQDTIARDIYKLYTLTLAAVNDFVHDNYSEKFTLDNAQKMMDMLAGLTNNLLEEKVKKEDKAALTKLIEDQKTFVSMTFDKETVKTTKTFARKTIDEYYRLCLKSRIFNIS